MSTLTGQSLSLENLSTTCLQSVAESRGLKAHQSRSALLSSIKKDLTATLPFTWTTKTFAALPTALYGFSLVEYDGKLWLYGGRSGSSDPTEQYNTDFLCFDPQQGCWKVLDLSDTMQPPPRRWHAAVVHKDQMLVVGGQVFTGTDWEPTSIMYSFSFESKQWSEVQQTGAVPCPKARFCCDVHDGCIYVVPSEAEGSRHLSSLTNVASFDLESKTWQSRRTCEGSNFNTRGIEAITSFGGNLYTMIADEANDKMQVYRLDTKRNIWSFVDITGDVPCCRRQAAAVRLQSSWLLCGGVSTAGEAQFVFSDVYNMDLNTMRWQQLVQIDPRLPTARASHAGVVLDNCAMFVGGWHQKWPGKLDNICIAKQFLAADETAAPIQNTELSKMVARFKGSAGAAALTDVTLVAADGQEFAAHKFILACQSEVFDKMFQWPNSQESSSNRVLIKDVSGPALEAMLGYMYGGLPNIEPSLAIELFATSDKYGLDGLKMECMLRMQGCLQDDTVALVAQLARLHDIEELWEACLEYTTRSPDRQASIFGSDSYASLWLREPATAQQFTAEAASRLATKFQRLQVMGHMVFGGGSVKKHRTC